MISCTCGKTFATDAALHQHETDKGKYMSGKGTKARKPRPAHTFSEAWLWKHVLKTIPIGRIQLTTLEPSITPVSSASGSELVCSYNWRTGKDTTPYIPGYAAVWQGITLPVTLTKDEGFHFVDQNAARAPKFPFGPMFQATASMNTAFRFDEVDVLTNRNSLRKLLDFSASRRQDSFRLNLYLVHNTLIIERCEKNVRTLTMGSRDPGYGRVFEQRFTQYPPGLEDSIAHHRSLQYRLGDLVCVVQFEVDACYDEGGTASDESNTLSSAMEKHSLDDTPRDNTAITRPPGQEAPMAQELAAEIKTASKPKSIGKNLPQLWFGRTPWLIVGQHDQGTFTECRVTNATERLADWEQQKQADLRRLVTILGQLREVVRSNEGEHCIAICEKKVFPPVIEVFPSIKAKEAVPDDLRGKLWDAEAGGHVTGAAH